MLRLPSACAALALALSLATTSLSGCGDRDATFGAPLVEAGCLAEPIPEARVRLLTRAELDNTIASVFGVTERHAKRLLPVEPATNGYDNSAALEMQELRTDQTFALAEAVASSFTQGLASKIGCSGDDACARAYLAERAPLAWRGPVSDDDVTRLLAIYQAERARGGSFDDAIGLATQALITAPRFLYRTELGVPGGMLTAHELASALSYSLTAGPPDEVLRAAADSNALLNDAVLEQHARRLLDTPAGHAQMERFVFAWLGLDRIDTVDKASDVYPSFDAALRADLRREAERFIEQVLFHDDRKLRTLLQAPYSFTTERLAALYGTSSPASSGAEGLVNLDRRPGILTRGAALAAHALPTGSSPVRRGLLVRSRLLCQELPPPPPDVPMNPPPLSAEVHTTRDRFAAHARSSSCVSCHRMLDPLGFAFEGYDGIGQRRTEEQGFPVDTTGELLGTAASDGAFDDEAGLLARLADSDEVKRCFVTNWTMFVQGQAGSFRKHCTPQGAVERFRGSGGDIIDLVVAFAKARESTMRAREVE